MTGTDRILMPDQRMRVFISSTLGELAAERAAARRAIARGAGMDWDQAIAYTLTETTEALNELQSQTQP